MILLYTDSNWLGNLVGKKFSFITTKTINITQNVQNQNLKMKNENLSMRYSKKLTTKATKWNEILCWEIKTVNMFVFPKFMSIHDIL